MTDLSQANLHGADLSEADLSSAWLWMADLREANLTGAGGWAADLDEANLNRTSLRETVLGEPRVTDWQLAQTRTLKGATIPGGTVHE